MNTENIWNFVEKFYPNYSSSDEILHNDDLLKLLEEEAETDSGAEDIFNSIRQELIDLFGTEPCQEEIIKVAEQRYADSLVQIYEKAIKGYFLTLN
jgi:hypothetical protein